MTQLGKEAPPNIDDRLSFLNRAVSVLCNPEDRHITALDGAKIIANRYLVALLFPTVSYPRLPPSLQRQKPFSFVLSFPDRTQLRVWTTKPRLVACYTTGSMPAAECTRFDTTHMVKRGPAS
eukprot:1176308-Prorocentrum_minimum.AAC.4